MDESDSGDSAATPLDAGQTKCLMCGLTVAEQRPQNVVLATGYSPQPSRLVSSVY
jgi:hypothetical protein